MSKRDDGGKAFPYSPAPHRYGEEPPDLGGMSLRDYFAASALQGLVVAGCIVGSELMSAERIATVAYVQADEMIKAREQ